MIKLKRKSRFLRTSGFKEFSVNDNLTAGTRGQGRWTKQRVWFWRLETAQGYFSADDQGVLFWRFTTSVIAALDVAVVDVICVWVTSCDWVVHGSVICERYISIAKNTYVYFHISGAPQYGKTYCKTKFSNSRIFLLSHSKKRKIKSRGGSSMCWSF